MVASGNLVQKHRSLVTSAQTQTFLFLNQNIYCECLKEPSQWDCSFEHPKRMFKLMDKKILTILHPKFHIPTNFTFHILCRSIRESGPNTDLLWHLTEQTFLFLNQNIYFRCSKEPSHTEGSFEHPKQMFKLMDKKILTISHPKFSHTNILDSPNPVW